MPNDVPLPDDPDDVTPEGRLAALRKRVRSIVYGAYVAFAILFILLSITSLVDGVFHTTAAPLSSSTPTPDTKICVDGVRSLTAALDRGRLAAAAKRESADLKQAFDAALAPDWDDEARLSVACGHDPRGADAFAALLRLRRAEEGFLGREIAEIAPLRRDVEAYLPPAPRLE